MVRTHILSCSSSAHPKPFSWFTEQHNQVKGQLEHTSHTSMSYHGLSILQEFLALVYDALISENVPVKPVSYKYRLKESKLPFLVSWGKLLSLWVCR